MTRKPLVMTDVGHNFAAVVLWYADNSGHELDLGNRQMYNVRIDG